MSKSYEERMAEKYNFLKKDNDKAPEISEKNLQNFEKRGGRQDA